jgi:hypothetical protein
MDWWNRSSLALKGSGDYERVPADDPDDPDDAPVDQPPIHHIVPDLEPDRSPPPEDVSGSSESTSYYYVC